MKFNRGLAPDPKWAEMSERHRGPRYAVQCQDADQFWCYVYEDLKSVADAERLALDWKDLAKQAVRIVRQPSRQIVKEL